MEVVTVEQLCLVSSQNVPLSEAMSWYPAITPPAESKNDIFIAADFANVDTHALNVSLFRFSRLFANVRLFRFSGLFANVSLFRFSRLFANVSLFKFSRLFANVSLFRFSRFFANVSLLSFSPVCLLTLVCSGFLACLLTVLVSRYRRLTPYGQLSGPSYMQQDPCYQ